MTAQPVTQDSRIGAATVSTVRESVLGGLGRAPELSIVVALGLVAIATAYTASRFSWVYAEPLFWLGFAVVFFPVALRLLGTSAGRTERIALILLVAVGLNVAKILHDPVGVTFTDEFSAWRNVIELVSTGHLFGFNPLHPASAFYPGLPLAVGTVSILGGVGFAPAGFLVILAGRFVAALALFLFLEDASGSPRIAGIGTLVYAANPNFLFFGSQVAYESLALPFGLLSLYLVAWRRHLHGLPAAAVTALAFLTIAITVLTHHLTSIALAVFLVTWMLVAVFRRSTRAEAGRVAPFALFAAVAAAAWSLFVATQMVAYLNPILSGAIGDFYRLLAGESGPRVLFRYSGEAAPPWEQFTGYASVALLVIGLPFGLWRLVRSRMKEPLAVMLGLAALAYPGTLALRLTSAGAETANRTSEFVFLGIGFVVALAVGELWLRRVSVSRTTLFATLATVVFIGGVIIGWARWARMPGPYLVGADTRSVEAESIEIARWSLEVLGPGNRTVSDRTNRSLLGTYGMQRPVTGYGDLVDTKSLILSPRLGPAEQRVALLGNVRYVYIDRRLSSALPLSGIYVERGELTAVGIWRVPLAAIRLAKFDDIPTISRMFDSGDIQIYDVERWWAGDG